MASFIVAAGSSCPNAPDYFNKAARLISNSRHLRLHGMSRIYQNGSLGVPINRMFYNCAIAISSKLEPHVFYRELKAIEYNLGRIRTYHNAPRTIDLDVLLSLNNSYRSHTFFLPHPEAFKRSFFIVCALELIKSVNWPTPLALLQARHKLARNYMYARST